MTPSDCVFLSTATDAVDAALVTKDVAVVRFASELGVPFSKVAAIGDSENDLPFLLLPGLALAGAPSNAQPRVKAALAELPHGVLLKAAMLDGFEQFYKMCAARGVEVVFSDRDGVLRWRDDGRNTARLQALFQTMGGPEHPLIVVVTGSSEDQNIAFIRDHKLDEALESNRSLPSGEHIFLAENGLVQLGAASRRSAVRWDWVDSELLRALQGPFRTELIARMECGVLPRHRMEFSTRREHQSSAVYMPPKRTMVTCNIPRSHGHIEDYRRDPSSDLLRQDILNEMKAAARVAGIRYCVV